MKLTFLKKKLRDLRRKSRNIDMFFRSVDIDSLIEKMKKEEDFTLQLYIDPWYRLYDTWSNTSFKNPPHSLKKRIVEYLSSLYEKISENKNDNEYLKIWIFEKEFMASQLVFSSTSKEYYESLFEPSSKDSFSQTVLSLFSQWIKENYSIEYGKFRDNNFEDNVACLCK